MSRSSGRKARPVLNCSASRYDLVPECAEELGWDVVDDNAEDSAFNVYWLDTSVSNERVMKMSGYQYINHFPGMSGIAGKGHMARNLTRMRKLLPEEYDFFPQTWSIPAEWSDFQRHVDEVGRSNLYICKPERGCQGKGIFLTRNPNDIKALDKYVVQEYVENPFLYEGYKFDLRLYVLVMDVDPLQIFIHRDGLMRLCTEKYKRPTARNISKSYMHLTNYAINKNSTNFVDPGTDEHTGEEMGTKRSLKFFKRWLSEEGYSVKDIWSDIHSLVVHTLISIQPLLAHTLRTCHPDGSRTCFEILGFDVLLDSNCKPWLLEVNHSPSFQHDADLDYEIKKSVIGEALRLLHVQGNDKRKYEQRQRQGARRRMYGETSSVSDAPDDVRRREWKRRARHADKTCDQYECIYPVRRNADGRLLWPEADTEDPYRSLIDASADGLMPSRSLSSLRSALAGMDAKLEAHSSRLRCRTASNSSRSSATSSSAIVDRTARSSSLPRAQPTKSAGTAPERNHTGQLRNLLRTMSEPHQHSAQTAGKYHMSRLNQLAETRRTSSRESSSSSVGTKPNPLWVMEKSNGKTVSGESKSSEVQTRSPVMISGFRLQNRYEGELGSGLLLHRMDTYPLQTADVMRSSGEQPVTLSGSPSSLDGSQDRTTQQPARFQSSLYEFTHVPIGTPSPTAAARPPKGKQLARGTGSSKQRGGPGQSHRY